MATIALALTPALALLLSGRLAHPGYAPTSTLGSSYAELAGRGELLAPEGSLARASGGRLLGAIQPAVEKDQNARRPGGKRFIPLGRSGAGIAGGGLTFLLPGPPAPAPAQGPRIILRFGRNRAAALFGRSF